MTRKLKLLIAAISAVLALGAIGASTAAALKFTASSYPMTITGVSSLGNGAWNTEAGSLECKEHFEGTLTEPTEVVWMTVSFSECRAFGFLSATVHLNDCAIGFYSNGAMDVSCPPNKFIEVTAGTCVFHVMSQSGLSGIQLSNSSSHILVLMSVKNLTYNVTKDGTFCPFKGTGHKTGMSWIFNQVMTLRPVSPGSLALA